MCAYVIFSCSHKCKCISLMIITLKPRKSASLPFSMRDTKKPIANSRPPRIAKPNAELCWVLMTVRRDDAFGRHNRTIRIRDVRELPMQLPSPLSPRSDVTSLELVDPCMLLQSVISEK